VNTAPHARTAVGQEIPTSQPVSHQGIAPATTPGARKRNTTVPIAAFILRIRGIVAGSKGGRPPPDRQPQGQMYRRLEGRLTRYDWEASTRRIASTERSTSASVVVQLETEIRISH